MREHYQGKGCNVAVLAPHGPVRLSSVGFRDIPLVGDGLAEARRLIAESLEQGALGFSTGLSYYPNSYSDTEELVALNETVAQHGGVYVVHVRNHNNDRAPGGTGITEALEVGRRCGVAVHVSHYRTHPPNAGQVAELMEENRRRQGRRHRRDARDLPLRRRRDRAWLLHRRRVPRGRDRRAARAAGRPRAAPTLARIDAHALPRRAPGLGLDLDRPSAPAPLRGHGDGRCRGRAGA